MKLDWSSRAIADLRNIYEHIGLNDPHAAEKTIRRILKRCRDLAALPQQGPVGRAAGTRELVVAGLPYIVVYRPSDNAIQILRVWHGAQER